MRRLFIFIAPLCALALSAHCADNDEVKFKPQNYKPKEAAPSRAFSEKPYTISEKVASRSIGNPLAPAQIRQPEMKPLVTKDALNIKTFEPLAPMQADLYKQGDKQTYASTISPNKTAVNAERKPYVTSTNKIPDTAFVPAEKPTEKNPMLQPRQGIKELPVNDAR